MVYFPVIDFNRDNKGAFGELMVCQNKTLLHHHFDYNINGEINQTFIQNTGTVTQDSNTALLQTGTTLSSVAHLRSRRIAAYSPGVGLEVRFTCSFNAASVNDGYTLIGIGNSDSISTFAPRDGYFIGYNKVVTSSTNFHVFRYIDNSIAFVNQTNFNIDKLDGTGPSGINLTTTFGKIHVWRIMFQWLSAGNIYYQIENPNTGTFMTFHVIQYASANALPSTYNPSFKFFATTFNFNAASNMILRVPCAMIAMNGDEWLTQGLVWARQGLKTLVGGIGLNIITIRNKTTYASKNNRSVVKIKRISFASDGTKLYIFQCIVNATLTGASFADNNTNSSCVDYDFAATYSGGRQVASFTIGKADNSEIDMDNLNIYIYPGETFTLSGYSSSNGDAYGTIIWSEDL